MNCLKRTTVIAATLLLFACESYAQESAKEKTGTISGSVPAPNNPPQTATIRMQAPVLQRTAITGAPYCAEVTTEHIQTLADGTHITNKAHSTKDCRDSEGRTRTESHMLRSFNPASEGVLIVEIADPVSGFRYVLDTQNHVAHRFAPPAEKADGVATYSQTGRANSSPTNSVSVRTAAPTPAQANRPERVTESLGTQVIEGVLVEGTKTTTTFPVGVMGNDRPIIRVTESWHSPDLKITVLSKNSDPRMGESSMRLQNIDRTEPEAGLFRVPPDYEVVDENGDQVEIKVVP